MTLRQLEVFLAIARDKSFSLAAKRIHLSQPTASEHMQELEKELGTTLFSRRGRAIALSEAGRVFETYAARILSDIANARQAVTELEGLRRGSLLIGASTTPGIYLLPGLIGDFRSRHPGIELRLDIANSQIIEERVRANELDLGIVGGHELARGEECLAAGLVDELVLVVPPHHRWARRRDIPPTSLMEQPLLVREEGSATRRVTERSLANAGLKYTVRMELGHTEAIKQAVIAGLGVAFVSVYAISGEVATGRLAALRLRGLPIRRHFHVIHNEGRALGASARAFLRHLDTIRSKPPGLAHSRK
ncbi:MAG: selenium metabolism-associated LysR family transcriptional regulator [Candidatus Rokuibacteriota bacterium]